MYVVAPIIGYASGVHGEFINELVDCFKPFVFETRYTLSLWVQVVVEGFRDC